MGQAKNRKMIDPNYGKPKKPSKRGLIINAPTRISGQDLTIDGSIDMQDLRFSLLFWDYLCWPAIPVDFTGESDDIKFLKDKGILQRPMYEKYGSIDDVLIQAQLEAFENLNKLNPGGWAISHGANSLDIEKPGSEPERDTLLSLLSAVPVPRHDVPLWDIEEFKEKRRDQLGNFRSHLDEMIDEITNSSDQEDEFERRLKEMEVACADLRSVAKEWQSPFYIADFSMALNFDVMKAIEAGKRGCELERDMFGTPGYTGAIICGIHSLVKTSGIPKFRPAKLPASPYKYAYQIQRDL